jgi:glycosyltransferase involved in cell wall biosynthesis
MSSHPDASTRPGRRISVLVVSSSLSEGGAERFASWLISNLDRSEFEPRLCLLRERVTYNLPDDVPVSILHRERLWHTGRAIRRLRRLIIRTKPDVIVSTMASVNRLVGTVLALLADRPRWIARFAADPRPDDGSLVRLLTRFSCARADRFAGNSRGLVGGLCRFYPFVAKRISYIPNPTDFDAIEAQAACQLGTESLKPMVKPMGTESGLPVIISVGRLNRQKRFDILIDACSKAGRRQACELWIVGEGPERRALERRIKERGLSGSARLLGFRENPYVLMRRASLFVLTSDYEGLPNALIEAQGLGLPAISTRCPYGPDEIMEDGQTGRLVPTGDVGAVAGAIVELLGDPQKSAKMGKNARERVRQLYDAGKIVGRWQELIRSALKG